jgi:hypothetical protein
MYLDLKKYIVNYTSDDSKRTNVAAPKAITTEATEATKPANKPARTAEAE